MCSHHISDTAIVLLAGHICYLLLFLLFEFGVKFLKQKNCKCSQLARTQLFMDAFCLHQSGLINFLIDKKFPNNFKNEAQA